MTATDKGGESPPTFLGLSKLKGATLLTREVAAMLGTTENNVRVLAHRRGLKPVGIDMGTREAMWPAERIAELAPMRRRRRKA